MELFRLRNADRNDCGDWVIESDTTSIDLWVEYGPADDEHWQNEILADDGESLIGVEQIMSKAPGLAAMARKEHNISEDSNFETVIKPYIVLMLLEALEVA